MDDLQDLYQEVILAHADSPVGKVDKISGDFAEPNVSVQDNPHMECSVSRQYNPTCGDEITLGVRMDGENVTEIVWEGQGCAISKASASIMTETFTGKTLEFTIEFYNAFHTMMYSKGAGVDDEMLDELGDASVFEGVSKFPMRIKCALLCYEAFRAATRLINS
ncbi:MAG: SUF system NifU family Fe-S cluster assembly protein [Bifidobacteriaceae bacterium]|jgi:nitrogen fixation NifU-like protein|nr:SUF system NifU family Fe-S cluster assembly protein [Bifidobacteriaceae bacterium]